MADYWKSLPKKYCDFCKCWFADNKASVEFHERGFKHQLNVKRKLQDLQKRGAKQEKEQNKYNSEMMKIESSAMKAFQNDVSHNPDLAKEYSKNIPLFKSTKKVETTCIVGGSRFGDDSSSTEESAVLVRGRERALDTISKKFEKKSKWLEAKTSEGKTFYWNKETMETKWKEPKSGFLSIEEQKFANDVPLKEGQSVPSFKYEPYGKWKTVNNREFDDKMIDLQLPDQQLPQIFAPVVVEESSKEKKIQFKEKTVESLKKDFGISNITSNKTITFKKRKLGSDMKRNVRQRNEDE